MKSLACNCLLALSFLYILSCNAATPVPTVAETKQRPNLLLILTDDQSWAQTGIAGYPIIHTPNFDALAKKGIYFENGFAPTPTCTASRSAIISGQDFWRTGSGATLLGTYPKNLISYQEVLKNNGYETGFTGKAWGPGDQSQKPLVLGASYNYQLKKNPADGISPIDYSKNLDAFLKGLKANTPFSFWIGISEPHRGPTKYTDDGYADNDGGFFNTPDALKYIPETLPKTEYVRKDFSGYLYEIEEFDRELGRIFEVLKKNNVIENTLVIVTSDNGMPYPGAKADNSYYGVKVPFAALWGADTTHLAKPGINKDYMVSGIDIAPTLLEAAGVPVPPEMTGVSFLPLLKQGSDSMTTSPRKDYVVTGFERHAPYVRANHSTYPTRAVITKQYMYVRNFLPDRWPFGDPPLYGDGPAFLLWIDVKDEAEINYRKKWLLEKRPAEMLFDVQKDPFMKNNLLLSAESKKATESILKQAQTRLKKYQEKNADPILKNPDYFSAMPYTH